MMVLNRRRVTTGSRLQATSSEQHRLKKDSSYRQHKNICKLYQFECQKRNVLFNLAVNFENQNTPSESCFCRIFPEKKKKQKNKKNSPIVALNVRTMKRSAQLRIALGVNWPKQKHRKHEKDI